MSLILQRRVLRDLWPPKKSKARLQRTCVLRFLRCAVAAAADPRAALTAEMEMLMLLCVYDYDTGGRPIERCHGDEVWSIIIIIPLHTAKLLLSMPWCVLACVGILLSTGTCFMSDVDALTVCKSKLRSQQQHKWKETSDIVESRIT